MKKLITIEVDGEERDIALVPLFGYRSLPVGTIMYSLNGERVVVGEDEIDQTNIGDGYIGYGIISQKPKEGDVID